MKISLYFDGTTCNLDGITECLETGNSVIGRAFIENDAQHAYVDITTDIPRLKMPLPADERSNVYNKQALKFYFPGVAAKSNTRYGVKFTKPGKNYNPRQYSTAVLSQKSHSSWLGISPAGWRHNLQLAITAIINIIYEKIHNNEEIEIDVMGYSRGGITAIAFSSTLSDFLIEHKIDRSRIKLNFHLVDPVAGANYGKLNRAVDREDFQDFLPKVNPIKIGEGFNTTVFLEVATQERRKPFRAQLPVGLDPDGINNRPLLCPDSVKLTVRYHHACHQSIAYIRPKSQLKSSPAAGLVVKYNLQRSIRTSYQYDPRWQHFGSRRQPMPQDSRCIARKTNSSKFWAMEEYTNSVLFDCYILFQRGAKSGDSFYDALNNKEHKYYKIASWSYKNSNFFRVVKKVLNPADGDLLIKSIPKFFLARVIQCQSREQSAMMGLLYSHIVSSRISAENCCRYNIEALANQLSHEQLEQMISGCKATPVWLKKNNKVDTLEYDKALVVQVIDEYLLDAPSRKRCGKVMRLMALKATIKHATSQRMCAKMLYLAERIFQHRKGKLHFRSGKFATFFNKLSSYDAYCNEYKEYYSKDYTKAIAARFNQAKKHFGKPGFTREGQYRKVDNVTITYADYKIVLKKFKAQAQRQRLQRHCGLQSTI